MLGVAAVCVGKGDEGLPESLGLEICVWSWAGGIVITFGVFCPLAYELERCAVEDLGN